MSSRTSMFKRYLKSKRHTMEVDFDEYIYQLARERKRGHKRAAARNFARPVPARARAEAESVSA
jgi:hypothetical protein